MNIYTHIYMFIYVCTGIYICVHIWINKAQQLHIVTQKRFVYTRISRAEPSTQTDTDTNTDSDIDTDTDP